MSLLDRRLVVVTGKGGVGRTTTAVALGHAAAARGRRVLIAELHGLSTVAHLHGLEGRDYAPRPIAPGLDTVSLTGLDALDDFGRRRLRAPALVRLLFGNRVIAAFLDAVPGLHDLLQLGKIENLLTDPEPGAPRFDLVVVDAPATGHGLTLLEAPRSMTELTRLGPFFELAREIEALIDDPARTAVVLVALPEELPVNESVEFLEGLGGHRRLLSTAVINQVREEALPARPPWPVARAALEAAGEGALVRLGDEAVARDLDQARAMDRLRREIARLAAHPVPTLTLPCLDHPPGPADLARFGARLAEQLEAAP